MKQGQRLLLLSAVLALAVAGVMMSQRRADKGAGLAPAPASPTRPAAGSPSSARSLGGRAPSLPGSGAAAGEPASRNPSLDEEVWSREVRDDGWATRREREIKDRLHAVGLTASLDRVECRSRQCRILFHAAKDVEFAEVLGKLEDRRALLGYAESIIGGAPRPSDGGDRQMPVIATFGD